jgi:hypothetical protein
MRDDEKQLREQLDRTEKLNAQLAFENNDLRRRIESWIDMTVNCAGVPQDPSSLPQMLLHEFRAALKGKANG